MKEYVIYNINFPDVPLRTFRTWEEANKRVLFLANKAGYPVQDFIIKEVEA